MATVRALLHGGPLDGRMVSIIVADSADPPVTYEVGYTRGGEEEHVEFRTFRRAARNPYSRRVWDYEETGEVRRVRRAAPARPVRQPVRLPWGR